VTAGYWQPGGTTSWCACPAVSFITALLSELYPLRATSTEPLTGAHAQVRLWDTRSAQVVGTFNGHRDSVTAVAFQEGTHQLYTGSADRSVKLWNMDDLAYVVSAAAPTLPLPLLPRATHVVVVPRVCPGRRTHFTATRAQSWPSTPCRRSAASRREQIGPCDCGRLWKIRSFSSRGIKQTSVRALHLCVVSLLPLRG
jgi:hypothetical protein